ncbi:MAG: ribbon-helix-helix domain-containing protein [Pseudomonadota bacterium]
MAAERQQPINELAAEIDSARDFDIGLATAIRLYVLAYFRDR